jgi:general secretion pathway protein K
LRDAQSRFNINNLIAEDGSTVDSDMLAAYTRLLAALEIDSSLGLGLAQRMLQASRNATAIHRSGIPDMRRLFFSLADLAQTTGYTPAILDQLSPYLVALPVRTAINVNTAEAVVLSAVADLSPLEAAKAIELRQHKWFHDTADFVNRANPHTKATNLLATQTGFFEAQVTARYGDVGVITRVLLHRLPDPGRVVIVATQQGGSS